MNNRFKFRIWDKIKKRFYNGTNLNLNDYEEVYSDPAGIFFTGLHFLQKDENQYIIQQYTGLNDKNGKEVYEGDIVKIKRWYLRPFINNKQEIDYKHIEGDTEVGQVIWGWNSQKFLVSYEHIRYDDSEDFDKSSHSVEVIGNILENPELLK